MSTLLTVSGLCIDTKSAVPLVRDVEFDVSPGEVVGIVGESGSGKTMTALSLLGILPTGVVTSRGTARLMGKTYLDGPRLHHRPDATMVFQNPTAALNPTMKIGQQLERLLASLADSPRRRHRSARARQSETLLEGVGIEYPRSVMNRYPHQLSGGMNQRVMIAMALAARPRLLIADEPTTGLDVTVQANILELLRETVSDYGVGVLFVSHDLGVIAQMCQRVAVMNQGTIVEFEDVDDIFHKPRDPYTQELLSAATGGSPEMGSR